MPTDLDDVARDLSALGLVDWGLFAVEPDGSLRRLDASRVAAPDAGGFAAGALLLVTSDGCKDVGDASEVTTVPTLLVVLEELQVWAMDVLARAVPTSRSGSTVLAPALVGEDTLVWAGGGEVVCAVGELAAAGLAGPRA